MQQKPVPADAVVCSLRCIISAKLTSSQSSYAADARRGHELARFREKTTSHMDANWWLASQKFVAPMISSTLGRSGGGLYGNIPAQRGMRSEISTPHGLVCTEGGVSRERVSTRGPPAPTKGRRGVSVRKHRFYRAGQWCADPVACYRGAGA